MKLKRVTVSDRELKRVAKQSDDYKHGYFSGYVKGREKQYSALDGARQVIELLNLNKNLTQVLENDDPEYGDTIQELQVDSKFGDEVYKERGDKIYYSIKLSYELGQSLLKELMVEK